MKLFGVNSLALKECSHIYGFMIKKKWILLNDSLCHWATFTVWFGLHSPGIESPKVPEIFSETNETRLDNTWKYFWDVGDSIQSQCEPDQKVNFVYFYRESQRRKCCLLISCVFKKIDKNSEYLQTQLKLPSAALQLMIEFDSCSSLEIISSTVQPSIQLCTIKTYLSFCFDRSYLSLPLTERNDVVQLMKMVAMGLTFPYLPYLARHDINIEYKWTVIHARTLFLLYS